MKKLIYVIIVLVGIFMACSTDEHLPDINKFYYPIPETNLTEKVNVGAYYFSYTSTDWSKDYTDNPELGKYDILANPDLLAKQFEWASKGGLDFFIFNWDKKSTEDVLLSVFASSNASDAPKMVINYSIAHLKATNASPLAEGKLSSMISELKNLYTTHMSKEYYFKVDNQPVVMITSLIPSSGAVNAVDFDLVMTTVRDEFEKLGVVPYFIGELPTGWRAPQTYKNNIITMDAVVLNNWAPTDYDKSYAFLSFNDISWKNWCDSTSAWGVDYVPCIFPAYNDSISVPKTKNFGVERTEKFFVDYCNVAKRNLGEKQRFVIVNSWNDYKKGNTIEPATGYGTRYLEILKDQFTVK